MLSGKRKQRFAAAENKWALVIGTVLLALAIFFVWSPWPRPAPPTPVGEVVAPRKDYWGLPHLLGPDLLDFGALRRRGLELTAFWRSLPKPFLPPFWIATCVKTGKDKAVAIDHAIEQRIRKSPQENPADIGQHDWGA
jgi:hypothetical protein